MHKRNIAALFFAGIGGAILILTGYYGTSTGFWGWAIQIAIAISPNPLITNILIVVLSILSFFSFMGGWTVLFACLMIVIGRHRTAVYLVGIGAGMSLMGLIWNLAQMYLLGSLDLATFLSKYQGLAWAGVIFAMIARELIRYGKNKTEDKPQKDQEDEEVPEASPDDLTSSELTSDEGDESGSGESHSQENPL